MIVMVMVEGEEEENHYGDYGCDGGDQEWTNTKKPNFVLWHLIF
jgi:hypothetical protein